MPRSQCPWWGCVRPVYGAGFCRRHYRRGIDAHNAWMVRARAEALAAGLCGSCHKRKARAGKSECRLCAERVIVNSWNHRHPRGRFCRGCGKPLPRGSGGSWWCKLCALEQHLKQRAESNARRAAECITLGICRRCHRRKVKEGSTRCGACLRYARDDQRWRYLRRQ